MSFTDRLLLWLHIGFAIFSLGPVAAAMMATPRYIRRQDLAVLRYLYRTTRIFGAMTLGVFLFGLLLGRHDFNQGWLSASMTLFIVAAVLLLLVLRDQRRAITAIDKAIAVEAAYPGATAAGAIAPGATAPAVAADAGTAAEQHRARSADESSHTSNGTAAADDADADGVSAGTGDAPARQAGQAGHTRAANIATVERGRIATLAGVICAMWLTILVLMVWHG